jgi:hypothetical protein
VKSFTSFSIVSFHLPNKLYRDVGENVAGCFCSFHTKENFKKRHISSDAEKSVALGTPVEKKLLEKLLENFSLSEKRSNKTLQH